MQNGGEGRLARGVMKGRLRGFEVGSAPDLSMNLPGPRDWKNLLITMTYTVL